MQNSLFYNPSIQVFIATDTLDGIIDVSEDIIDFECDRQSNALSTFTMTLNNKSYKYTRPVPVIETLNRIVVNMTRIATLQVFSGYVTQAPIITFLPNGIQIVAKCTLKRLENTFWDSSIPELRASLLPGMFSAIDRNGEFEDGGTGQGTLNLLTEVVGWQASQIHIQKIPTKFINLTATEFANDEATLSTGMVQQLIQALDGNGIVAGGTSPTGNGGNINTNYGWARAVLQYANLPATGSNQLLIVQWMAAEESRDNWWNGNLNNPLNMGPGITYPNLDAAAKAVAQNISTPLYASTIYATLKLGNATHDQWQNALQNCPWDDEKQANGTILHYPNGIPTDTPPVYAVPGSSATTSANATYSASAYSTASAIVAAAQSQLGVPYVFGAESPGKAFDCSGLAQWACGQAGVPLTSHYSVTQFQEFPNLKGTGNPIPGDLVYFCGPGYDNSPPNAPGHVGICSTGVDNNGNGVMINAPYTGANVQYSNFNVNGSSFAGYNRPWANGPYSLATQNTTGGSGSGTSAQNSDNSSGVAGNASQDTLFNTVFTLPQWNPTAIVTYGSPQGFIMDEPILNSVSQLCAASFRSFQSLPNGDFVAWFPDYFGIYNTPTVMEIYNIEIIDGSIYHNDDYLTTHVAVSGDTTQLGQQVNTVDWLQTEGIISVQSDNIMNILFGQGSSASESFNASAFLNKYGMRPYVSEQPLIASHLLEFSFAMYTFMQQWAYQYSTQVKFTFMPELYPGMRISLPEIQIQGGALELYVMSVTHTGSMTNGYSTEAVVTCPSVGGEALYSGYNLNSFENANASPTANGHNANSPFTKALITKASQLGL